MKGSVKVAVIGCGTISQKRHLPEYRAHSNVEIVAVCDTNRSHAKEAAELFQVPKYYTDYRLMLNECLIDAVSVCTPNHTHAPITLDCLNAGKHVLCEKPMSTNYKDAERMVKLAKEKNVFLMIGHNQRFVPAYIKAKDMIRSGELGRVLHFHLRFAHAGPEEWSIEGKNSWFLDGEKAYFGSMGDLGVHKIDLIRWLLDQEVVQIGCLGGTLSKNSDVDDNAVFILRMEQGALGTLGTSWTHKPWFSNETILYCENGILQIDQDLGSPGIIIDYENGDRKTFDAEWSYKDQGDHLHSGVIDHFINGILSGEGHDIDGEEALKTMRALFSAYESSKAMKVISIF